MLGFLEKRFGMSKNIKISRLFTAEPFIVILGLKFKEKVGCDVRKGNVKFNAYPFRSFRLQKCNKTMIISRGFIKGISFLKNKLKNRK